MFCESIEIDLTFSQSLPSVLLQLLLPKDAELAAPLVIQSEVLTKP